MTTRDLLRYADLRDAAEIESLIESATADEGQGLYVALMRPHRYAVKGLLGRWAALPITVADRHPISIWQLESATLPQGTIMVPWLLALQSELTHLKQDQY